MGDIALAGSTSGTITLTPTAVAGSNTLTLPAATGTILTNKTAGTVLQVIQGTLSGGFSSSSNTFTSIGANVTITPSSSSNKILLLVSVGMLTSASNYVDMTVFRDSTNLAGNFGFLTTYSSSATLNACQNFNYLDSPSTTSAISYSVRMRSQSSITYSLNGGTGQISTLIALEIAA